MDARHPVDAAAAAGRRQVSALRRSQRRLLFGGGGLITLMIAVIMLVSGVSMVDDFHAKERQRFLEGQSAVDYFLYLRDRAYATSINANDTVWQEQRPELRRLGARWVQAFRDNGGQVTVRADLRSAVPWLVLGRRLDSLDRPTLEAYLGMMEQYSTFAANAVTVVQAQGPLAMYAYEPQGRLIAVAGVADEAELMRVLRVSTREQVFEALLAVEMQARAQLPGRGPVVSAAQGGRLLSQLGVNPINGQRALMGVLTMADGRTPYFRRVVFESVDNIRARLDASAQGAFVVTTADGKPVFASGGEGPAAAYAVHQFAAAMARGETHRVFIDGRFVVAGPLAGVDWVIAHAYGWSDFWASKRVPLTAVLAGGLLIVGMLWWLLLRLDRRVFAPALADASRVYESESLSRLIVDTSPVGLALVDAGSGEALVENERARHLALAGNPASQDSLYRRLREHVDTRGPAVRHEFQWVPEGGQGIRLQVQMSLGSYLDHRVWVCTLRDVTVEVELERTLVAARRDAERARAAAESASRAKSAFVATMSHEIRTPLNGVLGHLELLSRAPLPAAQRDRVERIRLSADTLLGIISDVLDFSKIEAGQLDIDPVPFSPRPLIEQAALLYSAEAQRKGLKLYYAIDAALEGAFVGDVHRIRQILNNLLSNAVKFTESGRIVVRAERVEPLEAGPALLRLQVIDSGIGLSEAQLAQLFRPFQQADASVSRRYGGSGLGLALCQQLARLLGGTVRADSTEGVGSVFSLEVPVTAATTDAQADADAAPLRGVPVTLLSAAAEWRSEIGAWLQRQGAQVAVHEQPQQVHEAVAGATLLLFGERRAWSGQDEDALVARHARVVRAYPTGPLSPEWRHDGAHVTCYATPALRAALAGEQSALPGPAPAVPAPAPARGRGQVLLVEDNPVNRELIQQQLEELGFGVDTAENGKDALTVWQAQRHRAVLTDINMPVMDGYALARALRRLAPTLPILAVTATALSSERERCARAGITDLLLKPLNLPTLAHMLDRYLGPPAAAAAPVEQGGAASALAAQVAEATEATEATEAVPAALPEPVAPARGAHVPVKVRRVFVSSGAQDIAALEAAAHTADANAMLDRVHAVKGVLLMLGERALGERFSQAEANLRQSGTVLDDRLVQGLLGDLRALVDDYAAGLDEADGTG